MENTAYRIVGYDSNEPYREVVFLKNVDAVKNIGVSENVLLERIKNDARDEWWKHRKAILVVYRWWPDEMGDFLRGGTIDMETFTLVPDTGA